MKKTLTTFLIATMFLTAVACSNKTAEEETVLEECGVTVFEYSDDAEFDELILTSSEYEDDILTIYYDANFSWDNSNFNILAFYNADFEQLNKDDFKFKFNDCKIVIEGDNVSQISGLYISDGNLSFRIRYLDSDQYAILAEMFAYDAGWMSWGGSEELYYTSSEIADKEASIDALRRKNASIYAELEGVWIADDGDYYYFYEYDGRYWMEEYIGKSGTTNFDVTGFYEQSDGSIAVTNESGDCYYSVLVYATDDPDVIVIRDTNFYRK